MDTYLFDFDGTLVDSMPTFISACFKLLDENGITYGDDLIKIITPLGFKGVAEYCIKLGLDLPVEKIMELLIDYMHDDYFNNIPAKNNVIFTLNELKKRGASLNVLTASPHATLDACLKRIGIYDIFDNVWSCSDDFDMSKSDPEIYKKAALRLNKPINEILFLDDNTGACSAAKRSGILVCGVYDESGKDFKDELKEIADYYIDDFIELLDIFSVCN